MTVLNKEVTANYVPAAAVKRRSQALSGITGCKGLSLIHIYLKYFYPTNTLVTGYDIIGFWVSRMIFSGLAYTGKAPFDTVCILSLIHIYRRPRPDGGPAGTGVHRPVRPADGRRGSALCRRLMP